MNKAQNAKVKNIVGLSVVYPAMARVFERKSMQKIQLKMETHLEKLYLVITKRDYYKYHEKFCIWFIHTIKQAKTQKPASWGQAAKMLDVALKVCVYYCYLPSTRISERIVPWLNSAIDTSLLKDLKRRFSFSGASTLADINRKEYEELQKIIKIDIEQFEQSFNEKIYPVQYDDIKWRELNLKNKKD